MSFAVKIGLGEPDLEPRIQDRTPAYCGIGLPRSTVAATATVTATATAPVTIAIAASAMGTRMYIHRDKKNGWGRSHLPPHGRGGNMVDVHMPGLSSAWASKPYM